MNCDKPLFFDTINKKLTYLDDQNRCVELQIVGAKGKDGATGRNGTIFAGTTNFITKFVNPTTIGNSSLFDDGNIGYGTVTPNTVAAFDIVSTTKGMLFPRMTTVQRDAIVVGATEDGLFIFNTTTEKLNFWNNTLGIWESIDTATGGDVSGSGTTNYITKWTDGVNSVIGDSLLFDNGASVGVGIAIPLSFFHVAGTIRTGVSATTNGSIVFQNSANANTVTISSGATAANYTLVLPTAQGAANSFLLNDGAGNLSWNTGSALSGIFFQQGGNSFGATARLGTNDAFALEFETNNTLAGTISSAQLWSIGTAAPVAGVKMLITGTTNDSTAYALRIDSSTVNNMVVVRNDGRVGIGTASPLSSLNVVSTNTSYAWFQDATTGTGITDGFQVGTFGGTYGGFLWNFENLPTVFATNNVERMRIYANGHVSIGGVFPAGAPFFDVTAPGAAMNLFNTTFSSDADFYQGANNAVGNPKYFNWRVNADAATNGTLYLIPNSLVTGDAIVVFESGGNVGIGTNTPAVSALLELSSTTGALLITRMTTAEKNALTAINGMIIYDLDLNKFQGYENGAWTNFI